jgi:hypothetical protein
MLNANGSASGGFGTAVDTRGHTIVVGAPGEDSIFPGTVDYTAGGAVHVYNSRRGAWLESQRLRPRDGDFWFLNFGENVQLRGDRLAVTAPWGWTRYDSAYVMLYECNGRQFAPTAILSGEASTGVGLALTPTLVVAGVPWDPFYSIGYGLIHEFAPTP